ncbi:MAG: hypothetical protein IJ091_07930 [Oscillospiraceae bacterium]|nr:hypothetical protein [Oscillospiraceae bacterium]
MSLLAKIGLFAGGALFGRVGIDALSGEKAKKVYVETTAAALRCKDSIMKTYEKINENAGDILADAKELNSKREEKKSVKKCEKIEDTSEKDE